MVAGYGIWIRWWQVTEIEEYGSYGMSSYGPKYGIRIRATWLQGYMNECQRQMHSILSSNDINDSSRQFTTKN